MPRIVLIVPAFPKLSETFIVNKFCGLLQHGWDVHVVCRQSEEREWRWFPQLQSEVVKSRVHVTPPVQPAEQVAFRLPIKVMVTAVKQPKSTRQYWQRSPFGRLKTAKSYYLDTPLLKLQPDIIHFEFGALAPPKLYLKQLLGCKVTVSFRGYDINYVGLDRPNYFEPVWELADGLHLLGRDLWQRAQKRGCPADIVHMFIPPAIDLNLFDPGTRVWKEEVGKAERPLRLLSVGRLAWVKGYEYALQAVQQLIRQRVHVDYQIIGGGEYLAPLAFLRHQLDLEAKVRFAGAKSQADIVRELRWADVFLHTAVAEGFSNVVLEAQAMKLPIVTSDERFGGTVIPKSKSAPRSVNFGQSLQPIWEEVGNRSGSGFSWSRSELVCSELGLATVMTKQRPFR